MSEPSIIFKADANLIAQTTPVDPRGPAKSKWQGFWRALTSPYTPPTEDIMFIKQADTLGVFMPERFAPIQNIIEAIIKYDLDHHTDTCNRLIEAVVHRRPIIGLYDLEEGIDESKSFHVDDDEREIDRSIIGSTPFSTSRMYLVTSHGGTMFRNGFRAKANEVISFGGDEFHRAPLYSEFEGAAKKQTRYLLRLAFRDPNTYRALHIDDGQHYGSWRYPQSKLSINLV